MNALRTLETELRKIGYKSEALIRNFGFADVLSAGDESRQVDLAVFTHVPVSYRSAAFGVVTGKADEVRITERRSLGAPIVFAIDDEQVGVWRVGAEGAPRLLEKVGLTELPELFERNGANWQPQAIHRAKALYGKRSEHQLDFVDLGLIPAIEHEVEQKLDRLLEQVVGALLEALDEEWQEAAFRTTFRLLAAKILLDREHPQALHWSEASVETVLDGIEAYYNLGRLAPSAAALPRESVDAAWQLLRAAISFRNISSDSLAFVYENTLVTADTRKRFGTHSTPRPLAEYVLGRIDLASFNLDGVRIFEPFTGAGTFLVSALRHVRDLLPHDLSGKQRHAYMVSRISGAEIDSFACEVAALSLILADYPNANGWKIASTDLFRTEALEDATSGATIVLCNPPWADFDENERKEYPDVTAVSVSKPITVLHAVLDARPQALGFVLPRGLLRQQRYRALRQKIADMYGRVELTALPDRVFQRAGFEGAVLVASELRENVGQGSTALHSTVIEDGDRVQFLKGGFVTAERNRTRVVKDGRLWIGALDDLWEFLEDYPRLGSVANVYRGLKWWKQAEGRSTEPRQGFERGVFSPRKSLTQFEIVESTYLDVRDDSSMVPAPLTRPWDKPKVLANVARLSRGPWRMAAAFDSTGLYASQGFFGIWSRSEDVAFEALEGILNGPLANAYLTEFGSGQHFTNKGLKELPLPKRGTLIDVVRAVKRYRELRLASRKRALTSERLKELLDSFLIEVDAEVLKAYDLPPRLERSLLEFFRGHEKGRRTGHGFDGWIPADFNSHVPLHEYVGPLMKQNRGPWVLDVFTPAPEDEVEELKWYVR